MPSAVQNHVAQEIAKASPAFAESRTRLSDTDRHHANHGLNQIIAATRGVDAPYAFEALKSLVASPNEVIRFEAEIPEHREATAHFVHSMISRAASALFRSPNAEGRALALSFHANSQTDATNIDAYTRSQLIVELKTTRDEIAAKHGIDFVRRYTTIINDEENYPGSISSHGSDPRYAQLRNDPATYEAILAGKEAALTQGLRSDNANVQAVFLLYADIHRALFTSSEWSEVVAMADRLKEADDKHVRLRANELLKRHQSE